MTGKTPIDMLLDGMEWRAVKGVHDPANDDLPYVTHEGLLHIGTIELTVYQLSNGRRVVPSESMLKFFEWLGGAE
jgi:hypothetical protein